MVHNANPLKMAKKMPFRAGQNLRNIATGKLSGPGAVSKSIAQSASLISLGKNESDSSSFSCEEIRCV